MKPNPGLTDGFNRYLRNLDCLLPRRSRKGDEGAQLLERTLQELSAVTPPAAEAIEKFLKACEQFRRQQYWIDEDHEYFDTAGCWLPLLVLGKSARDVVRSVLHIQLAESFLRAKQLVLKPADPRAKAVLKVTLLSAVDGITESGYDKFVSMIRNRFEQIESVYDPAHSRLQLLKGRMLEVSYDNHDVADYPGEGGTPSWLEALFELRAVDCVEMTFARRPKEVPVLGDFVSAALVIPSCPVEWRQKRNLNSEDVLAIIENRLSIGRGAPFHTLLTAIEPEWFALIESVIHRAMSADVTVIKDRHVEQNTDHDFALRHLARRFTFPPGIEVQEGTEYQSLAQACVRNQEAGQILVPHPLLVCVPSEIGFRLIRRLSDTNYVGAWARFFADLARIASEKLTSSQSTSPPSFPSTVMRKVPSEFLAQVNDSHRDLARFILRTAANSIDLLVSVEAEVASGLLKVQNKHRLLDMLLEEESGTPEHEALHTLLRAAVVHDDPEVRLKTLSAIIYFLRSDDVISDAEPYGHVDDHLVISKVLGGKDFKPSLSPQVASWVASVGGGADQLLARPIQDHVSLQFDEMTKRISTIVCSDSGPNSAPQSAE
jgi:hypothetical protein